ncbi:MAG: chromate efflux transporter [Chloroflexaceae bacterium]|nr:chromate efflux transporter [Chloroflexaceae bacterium]
MNPRATLANARTVPFAEAFRFWLKLGFISHLVGPAGQIAIMHNELVDKNRWIEEQQFLRALNFCMLLPGPEAQQLATYMGWRLHGIRGGVTAGVLFVLPAVFVLLLLSWMAVALADVALVNGLFYGIQPVVIAIVIDAVIRIGQRALRHWLLIGFAIGAFIALRFFQMPFPLLLLIAALGGLVLHHWWPNVFGASRSRAPSDAGSNSSSRMTMPSMRSNLTLIGVFCLLWLIPVGALWLWRGSDDVLVHQALFFTYAAFITFGGAYAVLSYISDVAVNYFEWLSTSQMIQGLGLAESTPGPLIMVTQYVGFVGAWNHSGDLSPLLAGTLGALITTYVTFLPCFLFIFLGAPYIELLAHRQHLQAALVGITAAVVGVIANLGFFFGVNVLFPGGGSLDLFAVVVAVVACILLRRLHWPIYVVVPIGAVVGMLWTLLTGDALAIGLGL